MRQHPFQIENHAGCRPNIHLGATGKNGRVSWDATLPERPSANMQFPIFLLFFEDLSHAAANRPWRPAESIIRSQNPIDNRKNGGVLDFLSMRSAAGRWTYAHEKRRPVSDETPQ